MHQKCLEGTLIPMKYIPYIPEYMLHESGALSRTKGKSSLFSWFQKSHQEITTPSWTTPRQKTIIFSSFFGELMPIINLVYKSYPKIFRILMLPFQILSVVLRLCANETQHRSFRIIFIKVFTLLSSVCKIKGLKSASGLKFYQWSSHDVMRR